jgi:8-amino-7-oxononanoate synthase
VTAPPPLSAPILSAAPSTAPPGAGPWAAWIDDQCAAVAAAGQWRTPRDLDAAGPVGLLHDPGTGATTPVVSFAGNDYLGLSQHPAGRAAAHAALDRWGTGAGAARLVVGARPVHRELEAELADWRDTEAAVLFATGFAANLGVLTTFAPAGARILSDELNHASLIDGARLARADVAVYRHADPDHAEALLQAAVADGRRPVLVTDTVFSMDGDLAPVAELAGACRRWGGLLVLDDAHLVLDRSAPDPAALAGTEVLRVGTLSKTLGSLGGFVAGSRAACDLLVNRARSYIFTTASTPADTAAALANLAVLRSPEGQARKDRLATHVDRIRPGHPSPVVPVVTGSEDAAVAAAGALLDVGILVPAIRPPTVPPGTSRLRVALSAAHTDGQIDRLRGALAGLPGDPGQFGLRYPTR